MWAQKDLLTMVDGMLCRTWVNFIGSIRWAQLIVPRNLRKEIIRLVHAEAAGHLGIVRLSSNCGEPSGRAGEETSEGTVALARVAADVIAGVHRGRLLLKT